MLKSPHPNSSPRPTRRTVRDWASAWRRHYLAVYDVLGAHLGPDEIDALNRGFVPVPGLDEAALALALDALPQPDGLTDAPWGAFQSGALAAPPAAVLGSRSAFETYGPARPSDLATPPPAAEARAALRVYAEAAVRATQAGDAPGCYVAAHACLVALHALALDAPAR
ncbi:MAG TPA: hypothetical protein VGB53_05725 [Rubricoccaceae bacterium]|jgi:hypothetical protein